MSKSYINGAELVLGGWELKSRYGSGKFSSVWKATQTSSAAAAAAAAATMQIDGAAEPTSSTPPCVRAFKVYRTQGDSIDTFLDELKLLRIIEEKQQMVECPYVVKMFDSGVYFNPDTPSIHPWISLRPEPSSVYGLLKWCDDRHGCAIPSQLVKKIMLCVFRGLQFLSDAGIIHGDLKPENLLIDRTLGSVDKTNELVVRISDFGSGCLVGSEECPLGTRMYRSPEVMAESYNVDTTIDIWSAGAIVFELVTGSIMCNTDDPTLAFRAPVVSSDDNDNDSDNDSDNDNDTDDAADDAADDDDSCDSAVGEALDEGYESDDSDDESSEQLSTPELNRIVLRILERLIGYPPKEIRDMFPDLYDTEGHLISLNYPVQPVVLRDVFADYGIPDADAIAQVVMGCIRYRPADRLTPAQLLALPWFVSDS